ncbi:MAG: hypothetical protein RLP02_37135 [Coleofasciculus sp. C2-GNP5-27]
MFRRLGTAVTGEYYCKTIIDEKSEGDRDSITKSSPSKTLNWQGLQ